MAETPILFAVSIRVIKHPSPSSLFPTRYAMIYPACGLFALLPTPLRYCGAIRRDNSSAVGVSKGMCRSMGMGGCSGCFSFSLPCEEMSLFGFLPEPVILGRPCSPFRRWMVSLSSWFSFSKAVIFADMLSTVFISTMTMERNCSIGVLL